METECGHVQYVALDLDGVLVESDSIEVDEIHRALADSGHRITAGAIRKAVSGRSGARGRALLERQFGIELNQGFWMSLDAKLQARYADELRPRPGALQALEYLNTCAIPWAIVTNSRRLSAYTKIRCSGLAKAAAAAPLYAYEDLPAEKPHTGIYRRIARWKDIPFSQLLVIDDSVAVTEAAQGAGFMTIHISTRTCPCSGRLHAPDLARLVPLN